jgi:KTSC domain
MLQFLARLGIRAAGGFLSEEIGAGGLLGAAETEGALPLPLHGSSFIVSGSYAPATGTLTLTFVSGRSYEYSVSPYVVAGFLTAPSHGGFYNQYIKH